MIDQLLYIETLDLISYHICRYNIIINKLYKNEKILNNTNNSCIYFNNKL